MRAADGRVRRNSPRTGTHRGLDDGVTEVQIRHGGRHVFAERLGELSLQPGRAFPNLDMAIHALAGACRRTVSDTYPILEARLDVFDARLAAILRPLARGGAVMTIRRFPLRYTLEQLVARGSMSMGRAEALQRSVRGKRTLLISGEGGSGKTTLLTALLGAIPSHEPVCVIEETSEIVSSNPYLFQLETRGVTEAYNPSRITTPPVQIGELVRAALRHSPGRLVIGEVRGEEAATLLMALNTGHQGGICTIHANSATDALRRMAQCALLASPNMSDTAAKIDVGLVIDEVIHLTRSGAVRTVTEHLQVVDYDTAASAFRVRAISERQEIHR
jgi:pilus assembly protein CpaF